MHLTSFRVENFRRLKNVRIDLDQQTSVFVGANNSGKTSAAHVDGDITELPMYFQYISGQSPYSTQHGTKGAEFPKVIAVLDDEEGRFSQFSYERLFGIRPLSKTDEQHIAAGEESVLDRTRRLLYVCISRAIESVAVVLFAHDVDAAVHALRTSRLVADGRVLTLVDVETLTPA